MSRLACLVAVLAALGAGCATRVEAPPPPAQARLAEAAARGVALARAGDHAAAALKFQEALRVARTIEDADAIAAHSVNLSIVYQRLGQHAAARAALAPMLEDALGRFPERRRLQAELRQAILELAAGDTLGAAGHAARAWERCARLRCELAAAILNVQAGIALESGAGEESLRLAQAAQGAAAARNDRAETANALRTLGRARIVLGDPHGAIAPLEQALEIDRALADARKILADLHELARASSARGDPDGARAYEERARAISHAAREPPAGEDAEVRLR